MNTIPFINSMPYFLQQDICKLMFKQVYKAEDTVYDVDEPNCDCLYFVYEGRLKVQAQVTVKKQ